MATMSKEILSGSTNGKGVKATGTDSANAVTVHTATTGGSNADIDEIFVYATNTSAAQVKLTIEFGGTAVDDHIVVNVPAETTVLAVPGLILRAGLVVKAFAGSANVINCHGFVNRIDIS